MQNGSVWLGLLLKIAIEKKKKQNHASFLILHESIVGMEIVVNLV